jgi:hypothetical protein
MLGQVSTKGDKIMTIEEYAGDDDNFAWWLKCLNAHLERTYGLGIFDLTNQNYRAMYDEGLTTVMVTMRVVNDLYEQIARGDLW